MPAPINSIQDVVATQLCTGCGACAYVEPKRFRMADTLEYGRRPFLCDNAVEESGEALSVCPGVRLTHVKSSQSQEGVIQSLYDAWGPVLGVWEGYAFDNDIRFIGSSGGVATALALYGIEKSGMAGVLHVGPCDDVPYLNRTKYSVNRSEVVSCAGSRYSPASPCDGLARIETEKTKSVFIGKPCDVAAVRKASKLRPSLEEKLGLVVAFFCAGTPSTEGTLKLLAANEIDDPRSVKELRFRGYGWPGQWKAHFLNRKGVEGTRQMSYADSWGFLQKYRQWRCYICPDHTGEFADISVGDPWYREVQAGERGKSLIVARTQRGLEMIRAAQHENYIVLETSDSSLLPRSQPNLLNARGALWGRVLALRIMGAPVPEYSGFATFRYWWKCMSTWEKIQSFAGTFRRVSKKNLRIKIIPKIWSPDR